MLCAQFYGVPPGGESLEECRLREAMEARERDRRIKEIEEERARVGGGAGAAAGPGASVIVINLNFQGPSKDEFEFPPCIKIMETVMII